MDERVRTALAAVVVASATWSVAVLLARDADCGCVVRTDEGGLDIAVTAFVFSAVAAKGAAVTWWARATATTSRALAGLGVLAALAGASTWAVGAWLYDPGWVGPDFLPHSADENSASSMLFAFDALLLLSLLAYATTVAACVAGRDRTARTLAFVAAIMTGLALLAEWRAFPDDVDGGPLYFVLDARLGGLAFRDVAASAVVVALFAFFWPATDRRGVTALPTSSTSR